jgi:3-oxo-5alpha-steroid 4-dehydrogenase
MDTATSRRSPLVVANARSVEWASTADVVVVGFGGAGVVAALQAREAGADVIAIDRFAGGGATAFSGGVIYAGGTRYQRESGFDDTPDEMYKYLAAEGSAVGPDTLRRFCEDSAGDLDWLEAHGVPHGGNAFTDKTNYPPDGHWLYYSGNEKLPAFAAIARPAPRGHRTLTSGFGGHLHYERLAAAALAKGVTVLRHSPVTRLVADERGAVLGVEINALPERLWAEHQAHYRIVSPWRPFNAARAEKAIARCSALEETVHEPRLIRAHRGVVLATGGFIYNLEVLREHRPALADNYLNLLRLGSMGDDGSGLELGRSVGGQTDLLDRICVARTIAPPNIFPSGVIVNAEGQRFVNEDAYAFIVGGAIADLPGTGTAWLVLEGRDFWTGFRQSLFPGRGLFLLWGAPALINIVFGGTRRARTLEGLARKCGVNPAEFARTIAAYNETAAQGCSDPFGKFSDLVRPIVDAPYYAVNMSLSNRYAPAQVFTLGGLLVDEDTGAVRRGDGTAVSGLYAAGRVAVGLCSKGYMSGLSIADTVFSGRRAGRHAATLTTDPAP